MIKIVTKNEKYRPFPSLNVVTAILILPLILWWSPLLNGYLPDFMDTVTELYPMRIAAARQIWSGELPLWLPNIFCGVPLAANPQVAVWYPPQWFFFLSPNAVGNGFVIIFHYLLAGFGAYFLARRFGCLSLPAALAGFFFQFGSMMVSHVALTPHLYTTAWIPLILLAVEHSISRPPRWIPSRSTVLVGGALGMQFLAGGPQISYYTCLILPFYWIVRAWQQGRVSQAFIQGVYAALFAGSFAAIQLVPTLEFMSHTTRKGLDTGALQGQALNGSYLWTSLVGFSAPTLEDTDSTNAIGTGALLLVALAFIHRRRRKRAFVFLAIGAMGYIMAMGACVPFFCKVLPLFQNFHAPRRALILWSVVGPILAGFGAQYLYVQLKRKKLHKAIIWSIFILIMLGNVWILPRLEREFVTPERFEPNEQYVETIGQNRYLAIDPSLNYAYDSRRDDYGYSMMPDLAAWFDYRDVQGYDPLYTERYGMVRDLGASGTVSLFSSHGVVFTNPASPVLDLLNVQYLVGRYDVYDPGRLFGKSFFSEEMIKDKVELVQDHEKWPLYRYKQERPAAWAVQRVFLALTPEEALASAVAAPDYEMAFIESGDPFQAVGARPEVEADFQGGSTINLAFDSTTTDGTFVVVSSNWMPGWKAYTPDGAQLEVQVANGFQLGVTVPAGNDQVTLKYSPRSFWNGFFVTLLGLIVALVISLKFHRKQNRVK